MEIQWNPAATRDTAHDNAIGAIVSVNNDTPPTRDVIPQRTRTRTLGGLIGMMANLQQWFRCIFKGIDPLPEDVVVEIVSRLPSEDVIKCRIVCKGWMTITSTPCFYDLHSIRAPSMMLVQNLTQSDDTRLYSLDLTHRKPYMRRLDTTKLPLANQYYLAGTCHGLVLLWYTDYGNSLFIYIFSPLTGRVIAYVKAVGYYCGGLWFHPSKKEYFFLVASDRSSRIGLEYEYKIFKLNGESTVIGSYNNFPSFDSPIIVGGSVYYFTALCSAGDKCIMILNIEGENIDFKTHPHRGHCGLRGHITDKDMSLLEVEGSLAFGHVCKEMDFLFLWILVDREAWRWNERYKINLNDIYGPRINRLHWVNIREGEMLIQYNRDRMISVNVETRRVRRIDISLITFSQRPYVISTSYQNSLSGLSRLGLI